MEPFIGQITMFAGNFAPRGWAKCDGQLMPISSNSALFSILGTTYGGDGRTTFALPDLRGRIAMHSGSGPGLSDVSLGEKGGAERVQLGLSELPTHSHSVLVPCNPDDGTLSDPTNGVMASAQESIYSDNAEPGQFMDPNSTSDTGSGLPFSVRNPYLGILFIIALEGIYPSRN